MISFLGQADASGSWYISSSLPMVIQALAVSTTQAPAPEEMNAVSLPVRSAIRLQMASDSSPMSAKLSAASCMASSVRRLMREPPIRV